MGRPKGLNNQSCLKLISGFTVYKGTLSFKVMQNMVNIQEGSNIHRHVLFKLLVFFICKFSQHCFSTCTQSMH